MTYLMCGGIPPPTDRSLPQLTDTSANRLVFCLKYWLRICTDAKKGWQGMHSLLLTNVWVRWLAIKV